MTCARASSIGYRITGDIFVLLRDMIYFSADSKDFILLFIVFYNLLN